ncbi:MAG: hypothetical protein IKX26_07440, partial [Bacteroidales bacterium]|nr:hypothetical protein [Bacteroidales bacterium]
YNIQDWMTTMQTKKGTANVFSQTLRYYSPAKPNTIPLYSGNISEWESVQGTSQASTYGFTYDTQGRLTSSDRYNGAATSATYLYTERNISYDRNGNILTLKRIANSIPNPLHNFTYSYNGDKLTTLSGSQSGTAFTSSYNYDGNGNMLLDGNQAVRLSYDLNNLVFRTRTIEQNQETLAGTYAYFADGTKFSLTGADGSGRLYIGPFTLTRKEYTDAATGDVSAVTILESADAMGSDARFAFAATPQTINNSDTTYTIAYETLYLVKDHLGSVRTITDSQGNALERNDYYPYGLATNLGRNYPALADKYRVRMPASFSDFNQNGNIYPTVSSPAGKMLPFRLLYNGKELQLIAQTRLIDYGARQYEPTIARWNGMDELAEKNTTSSTYGFCNGNPIALIDVYGEAADWVVKEGSVDYEYMKDVSNASETPEGYEYVGKDVSSIISHLNMKRVYTTSSNHISRYPNKTDRNGSSLLTFSMTEKTSVIVEPSITEDNNGTQSFDGLQLTIIHNSVIPGRAFIDGKIETSAEATVSINGDSQTFGLTKNMDESNFIREEGSRSRSESIFIPKGYLQRSNQISITVKGNWSLHSYRGNYMLSDFFIGVIPLGYKHSLSLGK